MESFIQVITKKAGQAILKKYGKIGVKYTKRDAADVVTEADLIANDIIIKAIKQKYPKHAIISEETGEHNIGAEYCWIIDPLDGTRNFATHTPMFATMVALTKNGTVELAAVYDICEGTLFFAKRGKGTFKNGKRVSCSKQNIFGDSYGIITVRLSQKNFEVTKRLYKYSIKNKAACFVCTIGSAGIGALYLADGRRDWKISRGGGVWDYAPISLIMIEAGCKVTNFEGEEWSLKDKEQVAANPQIHKLLIDILNDRS